MKRMLSCLALVFFGCTAHRTLPAAAEAVQSSGPFTFILLAPTHELLRLSAGRIDARITLGAEPALLALSPFGGSAVVTSRYAATVWLIDTATMTAKTIALPAPASALAIKAGSAWLPMQDGDQLIELSLSTGELARTLRLPLIDACTPEGLSSISIADGLAFVAHGCRGSTAVALSVIDLDQGLQLRGDYGSRVLSSAALLVANRR